MTSALLTPIAPTIRCLDLSDEYPEIGRIYLRSLTLEEKTRFELSNRHKHLSPEWVAAEETRAAELLTKTVCDEQGNLLMKATDAIQLQKQPARLLTIIYEAACRQSGLVLSQSIYAAIEAAEKKSVMTGS